MAVRFLDASVPLEVMIPGSKHSEACKEIMARVETGEETVITSPFTFAELYHILDREKFGPELIREKLNALLGCMGLQVVDFDSSLLQQTIEFATRYAIDFTDASNILLMRKYEISEIYSLDIHYDKFKGITRFAMRG